MNPTTARRETRTLPRNEMFGAPSPRGRSVREITSREETERLPENRLGRSTAPEQVWQAPGLREFQAGRVPPDPTANRNPKATHDPTHLPQTAASLSKRQLVP